MYVLLRLYLCCICAVFVLYLYCISISSAGKIRSPAVLLLLLPLATLDLWPATPLEWVAMMIVEMVKTEDCH